MINTQMEEIKMKKKHSKYPYIGSWRNHDSETVYVLFTELDTGTVIHFKDIVSTNLWSIGEHTDTWNEYVFTPYYGKIILENTED